MSKRVPAPRALCTSTAPSCSWTISRTVASPRPLPSGRVVKNGSKMRCSIASSMAPPGAGDRNGYEATGTNPNPPNPQHVCYVPHSNLKLYETRFVHCLCPIVANIQDDLLQLRGFRRYDCHLGCLAHRDPD